GLYPNGRTTRRQDRDRDGRGLDILYNTVGIESLQTLMDTTEHEWDREMAVSLKSTLLATQAAVPALERRGGGAITCVSSVAALRGAGRTAYAAAKAGVVYLASAESRWITGQTLVVDGELTLTTR